MWGRSYIKVERGRCGEAERALHEIVCKSAADGGNVELVQELNILHGQGCCHAVKYAGIVSEGVGATKGSCLWLEKQCISRARS